MWLIQIAIGSFWLFIGTAFLFRESVMWETVEDIEWFRKHYGNSTSRKWERFCRDMGLICFAVGSLLFCTLPFGVGVLGVVIFLPPLFIFL